MSRFARAAWTLVAVVALQVTRLFPGLGRVRARVPRRGDSAPPSMDSTLRRFRRAVVALWTMNVVLAVCIVTALVVA